jgi:sec-independent protein translocase protein TatA
VGERPRLIEDRALRTESGHVRHRHGARRLPELGSGVGKAIKNFKAGISGKDEIDVTPKKEEVTEGNESAESSEPASNQP